MNPKGHRAAVAGGRCRWAVVAASFVALSGCVDTAADLAPDAAQHTHTARRPDVSLAGATVAFVSVEGPPAPVSATFIDDLKSEAAAQDIAVADAKKARYLVRGYLSAYLTTDGAAIEYVWDVFARDKQRTQRMNDVIAVKGAGDDPWTIAGEAALASVAAKSAEDLAAFLSNTPEAVAAVVAPGSPAHSAASDARRLSYAPVD